MVIIFSHDAYHRYVIPSKTEINYTEMEANYRSWNNLRQKIENISKEQIIFLLT